MDLCPCFLEVVMWECPKCKRVFKNKNQSHYCDIPKTIDEYINSLPIELQDKANEMRAVLQNALPDTQEKISWSMPTYWNKKNIIQFACFKNHLGLYPGPEAIEVFRDYLKEYKTSKGTIQFPHSKPLPHELIKTIAQWCYQQRQV